MTRLSVNINKIATLRNARGGNYPNVLDAAINCERFGAEGITVHPRPDERHITYRDKMSNLDYVGSILYGGSGMVFNGMALKDFLEARKIKKKLEELENESTN